MGNAIEELATYMMPLCTSFLVEAQKVGIPCKLVDTGRTPQEQSDKIVTKVSWTIQSRHLPQPPEDKSEAFDVCPVILLREKHWAPESPLWARLGEIGERLGLEWGGRWKEHPDQGHFQWKRPAALVQATALADSGPERQREKEQAPAHQPAAPGGVGSGSVPGTPGGDQPA